SGVTHFHVGDGPARLQPLRDLLDRFDIRPQSLYPTHVERNETLMDEAVALTQRGVAVDLDTVEEDLARWLKYFLDRGGDVRLMTASSDASISSPATLYSQVRKCILELGLSPEIAF